MLSKKDFLKAAYDPTTIYPINREDLFKLLEEDGVDTSKIYANDTAEDLYDYSVYLENPNDEEEGIPLGELIEGSPWVYADHEDMSGIFIMY